MNITVEKPINKFYLSISTYQNPTLERSCKRYQVRIHGRDGQGVVSAAELLSIAALEEGKHSQAVPSFGSERMGAPIVAYVRIDD